jgi:hypothetical protein
MKQSSIPKKFKETIEHLNCIAEKRLTSSYSLLVLCDYFEAVKQKKTQSHCLVIF